MATRRSTRERKVKPIDKSLLQDDEADNEFWGQDAFADEAEDGEFDTGEIEDDGEDEVDSDFDAPEAQPEDASGETAEKAARAEERTEARKTRNTSTAYVDPAKRAKRKQPATPASTAEPAKRPRTSGSTAASTPAPRRTTGLRNSTKRASLKAAEIRAIREKEEAVRRKKRSEQLAARKPVKILTQEEKLIEAIETEKFNKESLKDLLRLEEEQKRVPVRKNKKVSQCISFRDRNGVSTLSFTKASANVDKILFPEQTTEARPKEKTAVVPHVEEEDADMADNAGGVEGEVTEVTNEENAKQVEVRPEQRTDEGKC